MCCRFYYERPNFKKPKAKKIEENWPKSKKLIKQKAESNKTEYNVWPKTKGPNRGKSGQKIVKKEAKKCAFAPAALTLVQNYYKL